MNKTVTFAVMVLGIFQILAIAKMKKVSCERLHLQSPPCRHFQLSPMRRYSFST